MSIAKRVRSCSEASPDIAQTRVARRFRFTADSVGLPRFAGRAVLTGKDLAHSPATEPVKPAGRSDM
jgi:hypothetical protein